MAFILKLKKFFSITRTIFSQSRSEQFWKQNAISSRSCLKNQDSWKMIWTSIGKPHDQNIPSLNVTSRTYSSFDGKFHLVNVLLRLNVLVGSIFHFYSCQWDSYFKFVEALTKQEGPKRLFWCSKKPVYFLQQAAKVWIL